MLVRPDRIEQRGQPIPAPGNSLTRDLHGFSVIGCGWLGSVLNTLVGDVFSERQTFGCPGGKVQLVIQFQIRISIGITSGGFGRCGGNLAEWWRPEIWTSPRKGADAAVPVTVQI